MTFFSGVVYSKDVPIYTSPHYTDSRFNSARTVFGSEKDGLFYNYNDRLWQWDAKKMEDGIELANESGHVPGSAYWYEVLLSHFHDKPVTLYHVMAGTNRANGYPYAVFGYTFDKKGSRWTKHLRRLVRAGSN